MAVVISEVISLANTILIHIGLPRKVATLKQCNSTLFSQLYETLTGCRVPSLSLQAPTSEAVKCQAIVDALNVHLYPHVTLDHIQGSDVAQSDVISIKNLLDIFSVLFHVPLVAEISCDDVGSCSDDSNDALVNGGDENIHGDTHDSNMISSEGMSVISEVLREELGHSSHSTVTDSTTELVRPVPMARLPPGVVKTTNKHTQVHTQQQEDSSMGTQSNGSSGTSSSQPPSLTISSLHSTSTEESRVISQLREVPQDASVSVTAGANGRLHERAVTGNTESNANAAMVIPSGESSVGTTPSPTLHKLHTPPQSPRQSRQLSPLYHSTPHASTQSRLFPISTSTLTALSSKSVPHPLSTTAVTPSVTVTHHQRAKVGTTSSKKEMANNNPIPEQSTLTTITTDDDTTLMPRSPPSPGHSYSRHIPDLTITDLHTTTMSSVGEGAMTATGPAGAIATHDSSTEDSDSSSTDSEMPPPKLRHSTAQFMHSRTMPQPNTVAQKVRFSHSTEQREKARHGSSLTIGSSEQSNVEVGDVSSIEMKLGLDAEEAQSRASVLATLYQNYLQELRTAQPVTNKRKERSSTTSKTGTGTKSKLKLHSRPTSKVASSKYRKLENRKHSKPAAPKQHKHAEECPSSEGSGEESGPECEQRPPTPTKISVGDNMFPLIEREFPFIHVSPSTVHRLRHKQLQQVTALTRSKVRQRTGAVKKMAEMEQKQTALLQIIKKELDHTKRLQRQLEQQREKVAVKSNIRAKRQAAARAKKYYRDYELQLKAKLQQRRTKEEQIFRRTFEEGLALQRERIRELKRYAKERQEEHAKMHQDQLESMENYSVSYRDQLAMLSESMLRERKESVVRDKAQNQMVQHMKRELRQKIESEIKELQQCLDREEDVAHFRELDAHNVRHKLSRMTFTTTVK